MKRRQLKKSITERILPLSMALLSITGYAQTQTKSAVNQRHQRTFFNAWAKSSEQEQRREELLRELDTAQDQIEESKDLMLQASRNLAFEENLHFLRSNNCILSVGSKKIDLSFRGSTVQLADSRIHFDESGSLVYGEGYVVSGKRIFPIEINFSNFDPKKNSVDVSIDLNTVGYAEGGNAPLYSHRIRALRDLNLMGARLLAEERVPAGYGYAGLLRDAEVSLDCVPKKTSPRAK